jgi:hypothetical protein
MQHPNLTITEHRALCREKLRALGYPVDKRRIFAGVPAEVAENVLDVVARPMGATDEGLIAVLPRKSPSITNSSRERRATLPIQVDGPR